MMFKKVYLLLVLLTLTFNVFSQKKLPNLTLTGTIADSITHKPLEFCNITFKNITDTSKNTIGCITNEEGKYKIAIPFGYSYIMQISMVGYKTVSDTIELAPEEEDEDIDYSAIPTDALVLDAKTTYLAPDNNLLETVTIKETTRKLDIDKQSVIVTKKMRENTIATKDVLDKVDGIRYNRVTQDVKVDNDKKVKILVDGIEKDRDYILNLNPKRIKKIEIMRNISGIYQIEGYNAIINIITFDNYRGYDLTVDDQFLNKFHSSNNPYFIQNNANINLNITRNKWNYYLKTSGYYNDMDLFSKTITEFNTSNEKIINGYDKLPNNSQKSESYKFTLGTDYRINKKHLLGAEASIKGFPATNFGQSNSFDTISVNGINTTMQNITNTNTDHYDLSGNLYYKYKIDSTAKLITYLYYTNTQTNSHQNINNERDLDYKKTSDNLNYKIQYQKTFKNKYTLTTGGRYLANNYKSTPQDTIQTVFFNNFHKLTAFAYLKIRFNKNTGLMIGSSFENYEAENNDVKTTFNSFQPRINFYKTTKNNGKFVFEYGQQTQYPYLSDLNPQITYQTAFIASMGNPELKPYLYHHLSLEYRKMYDGIFSYFSIMPFYNYSDNEMGLTPLTNDSLIIYQNKNFVKHENFGISTSLSFEYKEKLSFDIDFNIYKDWNKNLKTQEIIDWNGDAQITYSLNTKHYFGLTYQKEYAKTVNSLGYTKEGTDFILLYWMTLQLKGRLQLMIGYSLPVLPNQINKDYEETPYYQKTSYTDVSIIKNMILVNLVYRFSKGKVSKTNKNIDYENFNEHNTKKTIGL